MIDLHCHLLPGIDDGPADAAEAAALLMALAGDGVDVVAATPHRGAGYDRATTAAIAAALQEVRRLSTDVSGPTVIAAAQLDLDWAEQASDDELTAASYGGMGKYVLVDCPAAPLPALFEERLEELAQRGVRVVLAHPERNESFQDDPFRLGRLPAAGVLLQVNADSLAATSKRSRTRRLAAALIQEGVAHLLATDAHSASRQPPLLSPAFDMARSLNRRRAEWLVGEAPAAVLAGADLVEPRRR